MVLLLLLLLLVRSFHSRSNRCCCCRCRCCWHRYVFIHFSNKLIAPHFHSLSSIHLHILAAYPNPCYIQLMCVRLGISASVYNVCEAVSISVWLSIQHIMSHTACSAMYCTRLHHTVKIAYIKKTKPTQRTGSSGCHTQRNKIKQSKIVFIPVPLMYCCCCYYTTAAF